MLRIKVKSHLYTPSFIISLMRIVIKSVTYYVIFTNKCYIIF